MRSDFQNQMFNLIQNLTGNENVLAVPKEFMRFAGDPSTGLMLSQLVYWTGREKRRDGYIYKTYSEWEEELGIKKYYARKAKNNLEDRGLIKTKLKKANGSPTIHYKLNQEKFVEEFISFLEDKRNDRKDNITQKENINNTNGNSKYHNSLTESTTETTNRDNNGHQQSGNKAKSIYYIKVIANDEIYKVVKQYNEWYKRENDGKELFLQESQWQDVVETLSHYMNEYQILPDEMIAVADRYFCVVDSNDYNILHFISGDIIKHQIVDLGLAHYSEVD